MKYHPVVNEKIRCSIKWPWKIAKRYLQNTIDKNTLIINDELNHIYYTDNKNDYVKKVNSKLKRFHVKK